MKRIRTAFLTGFLVLVPVLATVDILRWIATLVDHSARKYIPTDWVKLDLPGVGVLLALGMIFITGVLTQNFVGKWIVAQFDSVLSRFPLVGGIYGGIKKFLDTVFNPGSDKFSQAVLVEFPQAGNYSIGFITGTPDPKLLEGIQPAMLNVFIPLVPNPTAGFYFLVPEDKVKKLDMTVQAAFKVAISMGVVSSGEEVDWNKVKKRKKATAAAKKAKKSK